MTKLYKYQKQGVRELHALDGRALLADEMGLGKTLQALTYARRMEPVIIVCPASLKYNWEREAALHYGIGAEVLEGTRPPAKQRLTTHHPMVVINYDILPHWLDHLIREKPQCVILDEVHYCKNKTAKRTKAVKKLCQGAEHVIGLSGTPMTNRPSELWSILNIIRPDLFPAFFPYAMRYCKARKRPWGWEFKGATNMPELNKILRENVMIRRLKKDVLKDLPDKQRSVVTFDLDNWDEYQAANDDLISWLATQSKTKAKKAAKAEKVVQFGYLKRLAIKGKYLAACDWIDQFFEETGRKLVLFAVHRAVMKWLHSRYPNSVVVNGDVVGRRRQLAVDKFNNDPECRLFIGQLKAAGAGINLQKGASDLAFMELGWTPSDHTQAEDRIHRIGQKNGAQCYYLVARGTIEEMLCGVIQTKQGVVDQALDGADINSSSFDVYDELEKVMTNEVGDFASTV